MSDHASTPIVGDQMAGASTASWAWAVRETATWVAARPDRALTYERLAKVHEQQPGVAHLTIDDGHVSVAEKADHLRGSQWVRSRMYAEFLQAVVQQHCPHLSCQLLLDTSDISVRSDKLPVFVYQKRAGSNDILLPDIDFLGTGFYADPSLHDSVQFDAKTCSAVFVGSTTGGHITGETVRNPALLPRLRAAVHFKDNPHVLFRLTNIVQYDAPDTRKQLEDAGFGGDRISWPEQLRHKFLLSMDGNGATCSRVVIALASNSVLLKYDSPFQLYYFPAMSPWQHYIPVSQDDDVLRIIEAERRRPGLFAHVAAEGRRFAETFLTRSAIMQYTAYLLELYNSSFSDSLMQVDKPPIPLTVDANGAPLGEIIVHIRDTGDVAYKCAGWVGTFEDGKWIEGFVVNPAAGVAPADIEYQAVCGDGTVTDLAVGGQFAGSKGHATPIIGFMLRLRGQAGEAYDGSYRALFVDGATCGPVPFGSRCVSSTRAPLQALQITLLARDTWT